MRVLLLARLLSALVAARTPFFLAAAASVDHTLRVLDFARSLPRSARRGFLQLVGIFLIFELDEVGYVKKRVALQAEVDKCRLHARQNACDASVVNGTREGVFVFAFVVDFRELIVFQNRKPRLMRRA